MSPALMDRPALEPRSELRAPSAFDPGLHFHAKLTAACAFLLIIAGGLVTSTLSSLSVPDWPLSNGTLFPRMVGGVRFEHSHRLIAGAVALMTLSLAWRVWRREPRGWVQSLALAAGLGILLQALLGGLTVLLKLPPPVSIAHACLGQAVFCLVLAVAQATSAWFVSAGTSRLGGLWKWGAAAAAAVFIQLALGALLRHTGLGTYLHMGWAMMVLLALAAAAGRVFLRFPSQGPMMRPSALLALLAPFQILLGLASLMVRQSPTLEIGFYQGALITAGHQTAGALILGTAVLWTMRARRLA